MKRSDIEKKCDIKRTGEYMKRNNTRSMKMSNKDMNRNDIRKMRMSND